MASESLSLEETNKVRISLGLAPLVDDDGGDNADGAGEAQEVEEDQDSIAEANWAERRAADRRAREEKETKERLAKARNQRELRAKLEGKGLGSAEGTGAGDDDEKASAAEWIKKSRKAAKARAAELEKLKAREKELEERDRDAMRYGENDLAGLKVGHGLEDFEEGKDVILTLKDNKVLEDGGECCLLLAILRLSVFSLTDDLAVCPFYTQFIRLSLLSANPFNNAITTLSHTSCSQTTSFRTSI